MIPDKDLVVMRPPVVQIGFNLAANGIGNFLTLDDPVKGKLNDASYPLAGDVLVDVTSTVREITVRRGRSRTLEKFTAGLAQLTLDNRSRLYDPTYASGPYYGSIVPRKQVTISRLGRSIYDGNVESWSFDYDLSGDAVADVQAVDGFALLAQAEMQAGTAVGSTPGARIGTALNYAGWPAASRSLSTGNSVLDSDVVASGTNVLAYIQKVEQSEPGAFFMDKSGLATFLSRAQLQNPTTSVVSFGAGSGDVPYIQYQAATLTDEMKNIVSVTYTSGSAVGGTASSTDTPSIQKYGQIDYTLDTLLSGGLQAQRLADWLVQNYKEPKYRVDSITVILEGLSSSQQLQVLDLELGDLVTVNVALPGVYTSLVNSASKPSFSPADVSGAGAEVSQTLTIDAIEHQITPDRHLVTFTMSETAAGFVLDSSVFGVLNVGKLGF